MTCRACGESRLDTVFEMDPMPLAGAFADTYAEAKAAPRYPLAWRRCRVCGLVNTFPVIDPELIFRTYSYVTGDVPGLVRHHEAFARTLARLGAGLRVLEIGGNDGTLLAALPASWTKVNVDPSDVAVHRRHAGYELVNRPFDRDLALGLGRFDLVVTSNALAHFPDLASAWAGAATVLDPGGTLVVEVHALEATLATSQWDTVYHEHGAEHSADALRAIGSRHGFMLLRVDELPLHGGLHRAWFRRDDRVRPTGPGITPDFTRLRAAYAARDLPALPAGAAAYGAAARASVYLNQLPEAEIDIRYVVDGSPRRYGRWVPGVGLQIVSPDVFEADWPPATLITAWNHAADIKARHPGYRDWVTAW